jgi:hypothetical protein
MRRAGAVVALACSLLAATAHPRAARADANNDHLIEAGLGMAIPTYVLGVGWHEGTHALTVMAFGAEVTDMSLLPGVREGHFYFGYTRWRGHLTRGETAFALVAPKFTDLILMGTYAALEGTGSLPSNDYGALAITVLATGAWVDFTKDLPTWNPGSDLMKAHALYGHTSEWQRLPWRVLQLGLSVGGGYFIVRGYQGIFAHPSPVMMQLWAGSF